MKSTVYELRAFYLPGAHPSTPEDQRKAYPGIRMVGGFQFTDGAMSLRLPELKSQRQAKYLHRFHGVISEVLQVVDVPARAQQYSPKSEAKGVLGLIDEDTPGSGGQSANGSGDAQTGAGQPATLEANGANRRGRRASAGSSVASKTTVDAAQRAALLAEGGDNSANPTDTNPTDAPASGGSSDAATSETAGLT